MGRPSRESSHSPEIGVSEVQRPTDSTPGPEKSDVLRHRQDYTPTKASAFSAYTKLYSSAWAELQEASHALDTIDSHRDRIGYRGTNRDEQEYKQAQKTLEEAEKRFDQTSEGQILKEMELTIQNAQKRLDNTGQKKELDATAAARKATQAAFDQTPKKMKLDELLSSVRRDDPNFELPIKEAKRAISRTEERRDLQSAQNRENAAKRAFRCTPEWIQLKALESLLPKAYKAWEDLQEQAQLYTWKDTKTKVDAAFREVGKAVSQVREVQSERTSKSLFCQKHSRDKIKTREANLQKKKNHLERTHITYVELSQSLHDFEQSLREIFRIPRTSNDIPEPNNSAFQEALQAWVRSQREFRDFQRWNNPDE